MKTTKLNLAFAAALITGALLLTGFGWSGWIKDAAGNGEESRIESFSGNSEYYIRPAGDDRLWHVINKYGSRDSGRECSLNNSTYTFTADSVTVVNEIASVPELDVYISGLIFNND
jgi:hypothetical protein